MTHGTHWLSYGCLCHRSVAVETATIHHCCPTFQWQWPTPMPLDPWAQGDSDAKTATAVAATFEAAAQYAPTLLVLRHVEALSGAAAGPAAPASAQASLHVYT